MYLKGFPSEILQVQRVNLKLGGLGGLGVPSTARDPRFAGSNPAEVDGFFQDVKITEHNERLTGKKPTNVGWDDGGK